MKIEALLAVMFVVALIALGGGCKADSGSGQGGEVPAAAVSEETVAMFRFKFAKDRGDVIEEGDLEVIAIPLSFEDAFGDAVPAAVTDPEVPVGGYGQVLNQSVRKGEVLRFSMLQYRAPESAGRGVPRGLRIFALKVDTREQPRNLARGDYVDVVGEFGRGTGVVYVAQRMEVVQVGERLNSQPEDGPGALRYSNITIRLSPHDVLKLKAIEKMTLKEQFSIVVRAEDDHDISITTAEDSVLNLELLRRLGLDD